MPKKERKYNMAEKVIARDTVWTRVRDFICENAVWSIAGFTIELASAGTGVAVGGAALAAGLSGTKRLYALGGAAFGALLHGFPEAFARIAALAIVLASQLIPEVKNLLAGGMIKLFSAMLAVFFTRLAEAYEPSQLLDALIASVVAGVFACCLHILIGTLKQRGFDLSEARDCALAAVVCGLGFMSLAGLDYAGFNVGRLAAVFLVLTLTARRGLTAAAAFGIPSVFGLCAADAETGRGAAAMLLAAVLSCCLAKYGKLTRGIGFVFFGSVGLLVCGSQQSPTVLLAELIIAGAAFVLLPVERIGTAETDFSDKTVALMLRERLCFAADAIAGVSTGLNAAAETLERRYSADFTRIADEAADISCKHCPNNMVCWGDKYELFRGEFNRLVKQLRSGNQLSEQSMSPLAAEECTARASVIAAVNRAYSRYLTAASDERRVRELRRIYTEQLASVHDILEDMGYSAAKGGSDNKTAEKRVEKALSDCGLKSPTAFISHDRRGRLLLEAYGSGELKTDREFLGELLISALGKELELPEVSGCGGRVRVTTTERTQLSAEIGSFQLCKGQNRVCGDCFDSFTDPSGQLYIVLSDGMGSGSRARIDSALACSMLTKLLKSGISLGAALETVNTSLLVKSADESFATLDICRIDLNTGECTVFKAGASTTYIKCADRLVRASLSSPPAGTGGKLTVPAQRFTVGNGDIIIMTTDGASVDEEWLSRELSARTTPQELSEKIARTARSAENGRQDDISVIAVAVGR